MRSLYGAIVNTNKKEIMVRVDDVYQKVLAIANKEQRGYITPQEFNLFADHAQMEIFEQYFYDLEQFKRRAGGDITELIQDKISVFKEITQMTDSISLSTIPGFYKAIQVTKQDDSNIGGVAEKIEYKDYHALQSAPLTKPTKTRPIFFINSYGLAVYPQNTPEMTNSLRYIRKPVSPNWTYVIVGESAMFDDLVPGFSDFELHHSEETLLVIKILQLAGINIKDPALVQIASQKEIKKTQQEKQ